MASILGTVRSPAVAVFVACAIVATQLAGCSEERGEHAAVDRAAEAGEREPRDPEPEPTGEMIVEVVDQQGAPILDLVQAILFPETDWPGFHGNLPESTRPRERQETREGRLHFREVALDQHFRLWVVAQSHAMTPPIQRMRGPSSDGDVLHLRAVGRRIPQVTGTLLGPDEEPLRDTSFSLFLVRPFGEDATSWNRVLAARTGASGEFRARLEALLARPPEADVFLRVETNAGPPLGKRLVLSFVPPVPEFADVGSIRLETLSRLASGRVVDGNGDPVGGVEVGATFEFDGRFGTDDFQAKGGCLCHSRPDGGFELYGPRVESAVRVAVPGERSRPRAVADVEPGAADVVLQLGPERETASAWTTRSPEVRAPERSGARTVTITVVDPDGEPVDLGFVRILRPRIGDLERGMSAFLISSGRAEIELRAESFELEVAAPRHVTRTVSGVRDDRRVVLERASRVRLLLEDGVELPQAPGRLQARLLPRSGGRGSLNVYSDGVRIGSIADHRYPLGSSFDDSRTVEQYVTDIGDLRVELQVSDGSNTEEVACRSDLRDVVLDRGARSATFAVAPDPQSYASALESLRDD